MHVYIYKHMQNIYLPNKYKYMCMVNIYVMNINTYSARLGAWGGLPAPPWATAAAAGVGPGGGRGE